MIKEALEYLVGLKDAETFVIDGKTYCTQNLNLIEHKPDRPHGVKTVGSLDALVKLITAEVERLDIELFVNPVSPTKVEVFSTFDGSFDRYDLYTAVCDVPGFRDGFQPYEAMMIALRSRYIANDGMKYLLDLLSHISNEESVKSSDNGVTQKVEVKQGVALSAQVTVQPIIKLIPYRTFLEIEQPASEFLLRLDKEGNVGLFEADGGMWKQTARTCIAAYLEQALAPLGDQIIVMR